MIDIYKKINDQIPDKDDHIVIAIDREYIQEHVKANYGRKLTDSEIKKLSWLVWEEGDCDLVSWIDEGVLVILKEAELKKKK